MGNTKNIREQKAKKQLAEKLSYVLEHINISLHEIATTIGYKSSTMITRYANEENLKDNLPKTQQKNLQDYFYVPMNIWENNAFYDEVSQAIDNKEIDAEIKKYKTYMENKVQGENEQISELKNLILNLEKENEALNKKVETLSHSGYFQQNKKYLPFLLGTWYIYSFAINPEKYHDGVILRVTSIYEDYSVVDTDGNTGYLNIRNKESYIEKATREIDNVVLIRFFNEHIVNDILPCSISSSVTNKTNEPLLNFAFMSRKRYESFEAKNILNDRLELQLKINLSFLDRIDKEIKERY